MAFVLPRRAIHLDFHTGPEIPKVGQNFDAVKFAQTLAEAHVDSVTLFAKCHHGHLYYGTDHPARHPHLPRHLDLLGAQIEALHRVGIRAPIYLSVQCDEYAANTHPEWIAIDAEGKQVKWGGRFSAGWQILDMSSPYQEYLAEQLDEVLRRFAPTDGIFLDMCWDQPSSSRWAVAGMRRQRLDPGDEQERLYYAQMVAHLYMARLKKMIDDAHRGGAPVGIWFNSRPKTHLAVEKKYLRHIEVECLPTGGWGYAYFPYVARFVRSFGLPTLAMTARFHKSWGDFGGFKPAAALKYECCQALSQGLSSSVGDQMHPRGILEGAAYEVIGEVYGHLKACEPWIDKASLLTEIGVLIHPDRGDHAGPDGLGVIRALQELRHQFDLLPPEASLTRYALIILPDTFRASRALRTRLRRYVKEGGALLVAGQAALDAGQKPLLAEMGIQYHGPGPYSVTYLRAKSGAERGLAGADHVMYEPGFRMMPGAGAQMLCRVVEPYFERAYDHFCSHHQTPPDRLSRYAAVVQKGRVITFSMPLFTAYGKHGNLAYRQLLANAIERLLPMPLLRAGGPPHLETSVMRRGRRTIVHVLSYSPVRRAEMLDIVETPFPLVEMPLAVRLEQAPRRALLAPMNRALAFEYREGYAHTSVTLLDGHGMIVFE